MLNSNYIGGELEITPPGQGRDDDMVGSVAGPLQWVALYGDCLQRVKPVLSGTKVAMLFDIHQVDVNKADVDDDDEEDDDDEDDDDEEEEDGYNDEDLHFFESCEGVDPDPAKYRNFSAKDAEAVVAGCLKELESVDKLVICLPHMYPVSQVSESFLKAGDCLLLDLLKAHGGFDLSISLVRVLYVNDYTCTGPYYFEVFASCVTAPPGRQKEVVNEDIIAAPAPRMKFIIAPPMNIKSIVDYTEYIEFTGNEAQDCRCNYLVTGIIVQNKKSG